jgi:hypothetical protein
MHNVFDLVQLAVSKKGAKFASFKYLTKETGELQKITVILGASTENLYEKDIEVLEFMLADTMDPIARLAANELLNSRKESLAKGIGHNSAYTCTDVYTTVNQNTQGIKIHRENGQLHIVGLVEHKVVLEPATMPYKKVNSSAKTIAKNEIRRLLPSHRFRQYCLDNVQTATMNGETLELV